MDTPEDLMDISAGLDLMENTPIMPDLMNDVGDDDIIVHMDLREPIKNLKRLVEQSTRMALTYYQVWLQDSQLLEPHKNLVDQCVQGEGLVQINVQIQPEKRRINIVDVLKPTDDVLAQLTQLSSQLEEEATEETETVEPPDDKPTPAVTEQVIMKNESELELPIPTYQISRNVQEVPETSTPPPVKQIRPPIVIKRPASVSLEKRPPIKIARPTVVTPSMAMGEAAPKKKNVIRWFVDSNFKHDQIRLKIPDNPEEWTAQHVQHWLKWAMRQFHLGYVKLHEWNLNGKELCAMTIQEFQRRIPNDPNDIFWTHLELLRKCKFVATIQKMPTMEEPMPQVLEPQPTIHKKVYRVGDNMEEPVVGNLIGNRTGNNGQIQLWQFLLELLTSKEHREVIQWSGNEGEFKLLNAEVVAQLWGERKHKTTMTYEKLSRALRYYYDGDMISKVNGKRFTYRFVCDLKELIGYDAQELAKLVEESDMIYDENSLQLD